MVYPEPFIYLWCCSPTAQMLWFGAQWGLVWGMQSNVGGLGQENHVFHFAKSESYPVWIIEFTTILFISIFQSVTQANQARGYHSLSAGQVWPWWQFAVFGWLYFSHHWGSRAAGIAISGTNTITVVWWYLSRTSWATTVEAVWPSYWDATWGSTSHCQALSILTGSEGRDREAVVPNVDRWYNF